MGHFGDVSPDQSLGLAWEKLNLTPQKHAFTGQKKCTATQNQHKKTEALKRSGSILKGKKNK